MSALAFPAMSLGFGMIFYGLSPLAGSSFHDGLSERGCIAAIGGIFVVVAVTIFKVIS